MEIIKAENGDITSIRKIFKQYQTELNEPVCFQNFEKELDDLPGLYTSPTGVVYLAIDKDDVIGCSAIRPLINDGIISTEVSELKRLYVNDNFQGHGIGKKLFLLAMNEAKNLGYESIVLETMDKMTQATQLYLTYGFKQVPAYFNNADEGVRFYQYDF
jgi:carbonic anhydrase